MLKKVFLVVVLFSTVYAKAQTIERNLLEKFSLQEISNALIIKDQWKPFPTTPAEWKAAVPDTIIKQLLVFGDAALKKPFQSVSASVALEYLRTGDREEYQKQSFSKRNQLMDLILAESIEGKGRFSEAIMNGVWSICEESFWGVAAHLRYTESREWLPGCRRYYG